MPRKKASGKTRKRATPAQAKARAKFKRNVEKAKVYRKRHPNVSFANAMKHVSK